MKLQLSLIFLIAFFIPKNLVFTQDKFEYHYKSNYNRKKNIQKTMDSISGNIKKDTLSKKFPYKNDILRKHIAGKTLNMFETDFRKKRPVRKNAEIENLLTTSSYEKEMRDKQKDSQHKENTVIDFTAPPKTNIPITTNLHFGAQIQPEYKLEKNFDLDSGKDDYINNLKPELSLAFSYTPSAYLKTFFNIESSYEFVDDERNKHKSKAILDITQSYILLERFWNSFGFSLGRQRVRDSREWLYDDELDAFRLFYFLPKGSVEFSIAERRDKDLLNKGSDDKVTNIIFSSTYLPCKKCEITAYSIIQDDRKPTEENPIFYGLRLMKEGLKDADYWVDLSRIRGRSSSKKLRGFGADIGAIYKLELPFNPSFAFNCAYGTGDDNPFDEKDNNSRQTGLQDNSAKFNGITRIKYYGELFDPELSNLSIWTAGLGLRNETKTSIDLVYHFYWQNELSTKIRDSEIDASPNGVDKYLGQEIDFILGWNFSKQLRTRFSLGYFLPGRAFPKESDNALFSELKTIYSF